MINSSKDIPDIYYRVCHVGFDHQKNQLNFSGCTLEGLGNKATWFK